MRTFIEKYNTVAFDSHLNQVFNTINLKDICDKSKTHLILQLHIKKLT